MKVRTAIIGCGAWGQNIVREVARLPGFALVAVADPSADARARALSLAPHAHVVPGVDEALAFAPDAVIVATPPSLHADHALRALAAGAHVMVEKPLATNAADAERLARAGAEAGRACLVGHIMRYHPAVERLIELARSGDLGVVRRASAARLSAHRSADPSVFWALAPHDLSIWRAVGGAPLRRVEVRSLEPGPVVGPRPSGEPEVALLTAELQNGLVAHIELSRTHAFKERRFVVVGDEGVAVFDDTARPPALTLFRPRRGTTSPGNRRLDGTFSTFAEFLQASGALEKNTGDRIEVPVREPLTLELEHFLACARGEAEPRTTFAEGAEIVAAIERGLAERA